MNYSGRANYTGLDNKPHMITWQVQVAPRMRRGKQIGNGRITFLQINYDSTTDVSYSYGQWHRMPNYFRNKEVWNFYKFLKSAYN